MGLSFSSIGVFSFDGDFSHQPLFSTILGNLDINRLGVDLNMPGDDFDDLIAQIFHHTWRQIRTVVNQNKLKPFFGSGSAFCLAGQSVSDTFHG